MNEVMWAFGRASGIVSLGLFTLVLVFGVVSRSGRPLLGLPRFSVALVHRSTSLIALVFLVLHVGTLMLDPHAKLALQDAVVPFISGWNPLWVGLGTVAFDLVIALVVTGLLRNRIGQRTFRAIHWAAYAMWPLAFAHALGSGTNAGDLLFEAFAWACAGAAVCAVIWRLSRGFAETSAARLGRV
ncbi:ferric reductase-like transmembrane domain-containing protein [Sinomonas sp. ASV486]|uniref:ferric reductase-like transmembrane domain-containing protein n=1 Tax=Sinomonas sp. ASV486 TaxID=3051170 RepID=UPI0027DBE7BD|nr:ferric reductase-like transmembrane domain-containing protein [Sinomonas sp. ASV486]MDQ4490425.1 ferric reductase-like transmembrane domain-containing protein [Sinomonas sp. ASV486]